MIQSENVEDRRVQVVHVHLVFHCRVTKFICQAVGNAGLHARTGQPRGEPTRVVIATIGVL